MRKIFLLLLPLFLIGCSPRVEYVPIESVRTDTVYKSVNNTDSVSRLDSVFVNVYTKGDTIYKENTRWRYRERISVRTDTIYRSKVDSIEVEIFVEKPMTKWQKTKMDFGFFCIVLIIVVVCLFTARLGLKFFRH